MKLKTIAAGAVIGPAMFMAGHGLSSTNKVIVIRPIEEGALILCEEQLEKLGMQYELLAENINEVSKKLDALTK